MPADPKQRSHLRLNSKPGREPSQEQQQKESKPHIFGTSQSKHTQQPKHLLQKYCKKILVPRWINIPLWARVSGLFTEWSHAYKLSSIWLVSVPFCGLFPPLPSTVTASSSGNLKEVPVAQQKVVFSHQLSKLPCRFQAEFKAITSRRLACWNVFNRSFYWYVLQNVSRSQCSCWVLWDQRHTHQGLEVWAALRRMEIPQRTLSEEIRLLSGHAGISCHHCCLQRGSEVPEWAVSRSLIQANWA